MDKNKIIIKKIDKIIIEKRFNKRKFSTDEFACKIKGVTI